MNPAPPVTSSSNQVSPFPKGVLLAGGSGSRLAPVTSSVNKHLLPVYNKPMIYYPLTNLILLGITEILVISNPESVQSLKNLMGSGSEFGVRLTYQIQEKPNGIAEAPLLYEKWADGHPVCLLLGDNILFGSGLMDHLRHAMTNLRKNGGAFVLLQEVSDPERYGVALVDKNGSITHLEEKPKSPISNNAVTGLYLLDATSSERCKSLEKSSRGEYEVIDLLRSYMREGSLHSLQMPRGTVWLDAGTPQSLLDASHYVSIIEERHKSLIGSPHEAAIRIGAIEGETMKSQLDDRKASSYFAEIVRIAENGI